MRYLLALSITLLVLGTAPAARASGVLCDGGCYVDEAACIEDACGAGVSCSNTCETSCMDADDTACPPENFVSRPEEPAAPSAAQPATLSNPLGTNDITVIVGRITKIFVGVSGSFALLMFVYGGFLWLTSGGAQEKVAKGKKVFTWAVIGLAVIFGGYAMLTTLFRAIGAS